MINVAIAIVLHPHEDLVLIAQRCRGVHMGERWEFPGGKMEAGELPSFAAVRETAEETGVDAVFIEEWDPIRHDYPDRSVVLYPVLCRAVSGDALPLDNLQVIWAPPVSLSEYDFPPANASILRRIMVYFGHSAMITR